MSVNTPPPGSAPFLKNIMTGRVFPWTELLAKRGDLVPCMNVDGSDAVMQNMAGAAAMQSDPVAYMKQLEEQMQQMRMMYPEVLGQNPAAAPQLAKLPPDLSIAPVQPSPQVMQPTPEQIQQQVAQPGYQHPVAPPVDMSATPEYHHYLEGLHWQKLKKLTESNGGVWSDAQAAIEYLKATPHIPDMS